MHLLYADESGHSADPNLNFFVLAGVSIFERQCYWLNQKLEDIAARFNPAEPHKIELHGSPMRQGRGYWKDIPLPDRIKAMEDALNILASSHHSNRIFIIAVEKNAVSPEEPVLYTFEQLASRFDQYLLRLHRKNDTQRGLMIFDKSTYEKTFQGLANDFREIGHRWGVLRNLSEVPLFLDSRASRLIQLADLVAYAAFRHFERNDSQFYNIIKSRIDQDGGVIHGLHIKTLLSSSHGIKS